LEENGHTDKKNPNMSIDDALILYLSMIYPNGIPDGVDQNKILQLLREKIAKEHPEWDKKYPKKRTDESSVLVGEKSYLQIKQEIIKKSQESEVPSDSDERYFYQRDLETTQNRIMRKEKKKEERKNEELIQKLIERKKGKINQFLLEKILKFRDSIKPKLQNIHQPTKISSTTTDIETLLKLGQPQVQFSTQFNHNKLNPSFQSYLKNKQNNKEERRQKQKVKFKTYPDQAKDAQTTIKQDLMNNLRPKYLNNINLKKQVPQNTKYFDLRYQKPIKVSKRSSLKFQQRSKKKDRIDSNFDLKLEKEEKNFKLI